MQELASSESEENSIDLESLSKHPHPCLASGNFSIFNSPDVVPLRLAREMEYTVDMDGVVVLSKLVLDPPGERSYQFLSSKLRTSATYSTVRLGSALEKYGPAVILYCA